MYIITICSTCDVHTYIHIVKDARLAGIFYWSQTGHIFGQRPSYTNRETKTNRDYKSTRVWSKLRVKDQSRKLQVRHIYDINACSSEKWCIKTYPHVHIRVATNIKSKSKNGQRSCLHTGVKVPSTMKFKQKCVYTCTLYKGDRVANNIKYEQKI